MVLADGSLITVDEQSDLGWAVKGAGHNFGIVTSFTTKIYNVPDDGLWSYARFIYTHDKVEALFEAIDANLLKDGTQPVDLISYSLFFNMPAIDSEYVRARKLYSLYNANLLESLVAFFVLYEDLDDPLSQQYPHS